MHSRDPHTAALLPTSAHTTGSIEGRASRKGPKRGSQWRLASNSGCCTRAPSPSWRMPTKSRRRCRPLRGGRGDGGENAHLGMRMPRSTRRSSRCTTAWSAAGLLRPPRPETSPGPRTGAFQRKRWTVSNHSAKSCVQDSAPPTAPTAGPGPVSPRRGCGRRRGSASRRRRRASPPTAAQAPLLRPVASALRGRAPRRSAQPPCRRGLP
mmetsp:Transcript_150733/g.484485  ORF Transcript_150733/g.484485 Transcript_150733/m.484485 type:complete len:209 (-) Transcript_150733:40-666(-)